MNQTVAPSEWNSAWRPVRYEFEFDNPAFRFQQALTSVTNDGGNAQLNFANNFFTKLIVGNKVYIESGVYEGEHEIITVTSQTQITIDATYTATSTAVVINLVVPLIQVYKGYTGSEAYPSELPLTLIAEFTPEVNLDYTLTFDISGYLQSIFSIVPPTEGIDFNMFNQFRIYLFYAEEIINASNDITLGTLPYKVLNSSIKTEDLNSEYVNTGRYLTPNFPPIIFNCGKTFISYLLDEFVVNEILEGEVPAHGDYNNDFNSDFSIF